MPRKYGLERRSDHARREQAPGGQLDASSLVCVDDAGNESEPADLTVIVREPTRINPDIFRDRILVREPIEREPVFRRPIAATRFRPLRPGG